MYTTTKDDAPLLEWEWAADRLTRCEDYWLVTADAAGDGQPAARPVWGVWMPDGARLLLTVGSTTHWRNLGANANVTVHTGDAHEVVIVEGIAGTVDPADEATLRPMVEHYNVKYGWDFPETGPDIGGVLAVTPRTVLAWIAGPNDTAKQNDFPIAAARGVGVSG